LNLLFADSGTGEILMHIELATDPGEPSYHRTIGHSPELNQFLRDHGVLVVIADYRGMDGRGGFDLLRFTTADGADGLVFDGPRNLQLKAMFRAILLARDPGWCRGTGSYGGFRWDILSDRLTHRHCVRSKGRERMIGHGV
jgi:hypothetical protein